MPTPWAREPGDFLLLVNDVGDLSYINSFWDKRVAFVKNSDGFFSYDAATTSWKQVGVSGGLHPAVQTEVDLAAVAATDRSDKMSCLVEDTSALFRFDAQSVAAPAAGDVVKPDDVTLPDPGRWIRYTGTAYVLRSGDTMTGALTLSGAPTADLHAATRKYVDDGLTAANVSIVADLTALGALAGKPNRGQAYVKSMDDFYILDKDNVYTPDGLGVIAATGGGYWIGQLAGRYDDVMGSISQGTGAAALTYEAYRDTPMFLYYFRHDQNDSLHFVYQFPHRYKMDTPVYPHIHVVPMVDPSASPQNVYIEMRYAWAKVGDTFPANASWTVPTPVTFPVVTGDAFKHKIIPLGAITPPVGLTASSCLMFYVVRSGTNILDTYSTNKVGGTTSANLALLSADVHFRSLRFGTVTEYT